MTIDKKRLKALAEAATQGSWHHTGKWVSTERGNSVADCSRGDEEFIAAANPATVLALLGEIDRLQAAEKTLQDLGYQHTGGELWRPPLGRKPDFDLIDQLKAENEALAHLLKRFVDSEHDDAEDQNDRHHYHGEAEALLARIGGNFREYSLVPYEALLAQRTELEALRNDAENWKIVTRAMDQLQADEQGAAIWSACAMILISVASELNAARSVVTEEGVTKDGVEIGDWRVTVERITPAKEQSHG